MSSSLLYRSVQPPAAVSSACYVQDAAGRGHVLVLHDTHLSVCGVNSYGLEQNVSWRAPTSILQMVHLPSNHLLLLAEGGHCSLHSLAAHASAEADDQQSLSFPLLATARLQALSDDASLNLQPFGCIVSSNVLSAATSAGTASLVAAAYQPGVLHLIRAAPSTTATTAAVDAAAGGGMTLEARAIAYRQALLSCSLPGVGCCSGLGCVRVGSRVLSMAWLPAAEQQLDVQGYSLLAVLHEPTPSGGPHDHPRQLCGVLHVDCLAVDWLTAAATPGPWAIRNVHPSSRLLQPLPACPTITPAAAAAAAPAGGTLLISSSSVILLQQQHTAAAGGSSSSTAAAVCSSGAASSAVRKVALVQWRLQGVPLSCTAVTNRCYIIGDDKAGLYVLRLHEGCAAASWQPIHTNCTQPGAAIPHVLCYAPLGSSSSSSTSDTTTTAAAAAAMETDPATSSNSQLAGLIFVGSKTSSSQVLGWLTQQQQQQVLCPMFQSALLPSVAGVQAVTVLQDTTGMLPECQLLVCCGGGGTTAAAAAAAAAAGCVKLAVLRSGMGLQPFLVEGQTLPGDAVLFPILDYPACSHTTQQQQTQQQQQQQHWQQQQQQQYHSLLGFSFPSAGVTDVLSLTGPTLKQQQLPGLRNGSSSILMAGLPGGWLLQVTAQQITVCNMKNNNAQDGGSRSMAVPVHEWQPGQGCGAMSVAAVCGSLLVVACGPRLSCFNIDCCSGAIQPVAAAAALQQQVSALGLLQLQDGQHVVAAGLWVDNTLLLLPWPNTTHTQQQQQQLEVGCTVALHTEQARSVAVLPVGSGSSGTDVLLVGTNSGSVLMWQISNYVIQQQQQQLGGSGSSSGSRWLLQHMRTVRIGNTSVSLMPLLLPAQHNGSSSGSSSSGSSSSGSSSSGSSSIQCIYAHAGAGAVIQPIQALVNTWQQQQQLQEEQHRSSSSSSMLAATDCLLVSRLCGSEGCLTAAAVRSRAMPPCSIAWISANSKLCFGELNPQHKFRWRAKHIQGTPLAMAVHKATNTLLLLVQANGAQQQQQLLLMDCRSLSVLMTLKLAEGHRYTCLGVLNLPCVSKQQQQQQQSGAAAAAASASSSSSSSGSDTCKPFIVLGSCVNMDIATAAASDQTFTGQSTAASQQQRKQQQHLPFGGQVQLNGVKKESSPPAVESLQVGMLSFFELNTRLHNGAAGSSSSSSYPQQQQQQLQYDLVLHGMVPLPVTPACVSTVLPEVMHHIPQQQQQQQEGGSSSGTPAAAATSAVAPASVAAAAAPVCLAVGSEAGVSLFSVIIDDTAAADSVQQQQQLAAAAKVEAMDITDKPAAAACIQQQQQQHSRVALNELTTCKAANGGVVTALTNSSSSSGSSSSSSSLVATECLGSVSVMKAVATPGGRVQLIAVGQDTSGLMAMDVLLAQQQQQQQHRTAASADLAQQQQQHVSTLVATHPTGLLLLQRDTSAEQQHQLAAHAAAVAAWEAGGVARQGLVNAQAAAARQLHWQQQQLMAAAVQPWLGEGEAAPWNNAAAAAARGAAGGQQQQHADRAGLAAAAAAAGGGGAAAAAAVTRASEVGVYDLGAAAAPRLMASAACAPAAGVTVMCAARLGLHVQKQSANETETQLHRRSSSSTANWQQQQLCMEPPVWCFSANGAVAVVQMLQPSEARALLQLQQQVFLQQPQQQLHKHMLQLQPDLPRMLLQPLRKLPAAASHRNFQRHRGAGVSAAAEQTDDADDEIAFNCVDGDLLFSAGDVAGQDAGDSRLLQHVIWQGIL